MAFKSKSQLFWHVKFRVEEETSCTLRRREAKKTSCHKITRLPLARIIDRDSFVHFSAFKMQCWKTGRLDSHTYYAVKKFKDLFKIERYVFFIL